MSANHPFPLLRWCWRLVKPCLPGRLANRIGKLARSALGPLPRSLSPVVPPLPLPEEIALQLDAILRELRRLHVQVEKLQEARSPMSAPPLLPWPQEASRPAAAA